MHVVQILRWWEEATPVPRGGLSPLHSPSGPIDEDVVSVELDKKTDTEVGLAHLDRRANCVQPLGLSGCRPGAVSSRVRLAQSARPP